MLLILFVLILIPVALIARVPQQLGLWQTHPERLFDQTPDPALGQRVTDELEAVGVVTEGMTVWVFRDPESNDRVVYAMLDPADGFEFPPDFEGDPVLVLIGELGTASAASAPEISRVAINIQGPDSTSIVIVSASVEDAVDYAAGNVDEQAFMERLEGWVDPSMLVMTQLSDEGGEE